MINQLTTSPSDADDKLTGLTLPPERFVIKQYGHIDGEAILAVLNGDIAGCHFRGVISPAACEDITVNFWRNPGRMERRDGVPGHLVGSSHYRKRTVEYLDDVARNRSFVGALFDRTENSPQVLRDATAAALHKRGGRLRAGQFGERIAGDCRAISWTTRGDYMLAPHDDVAQLGTMEQHDFEIQKTIDTVVVPVNLYPRIPSQGGKLQVWNIQPDDSCRARLGLSGRGYPYGVESLRAFDSVIIDVLSGDVVLINGAQVHGVTGYAQPELPEEQMRLLLTFFMGFIDSTTVVWWT
jgi:hypothetical protein